MLDDDALTKLLTIAHDINADSADVRRALVASVHEYRQLRDLHEAALGTTDDGRMNWYRTEMDKLAEKLVERVHPVDGDVFIIRPTEMPNMEAMAIFVSMLQNRGVGVSFLALPPDLLLEHVTTEALAEVGLIRLPTTPDAVS